MPSATLFTTNLKWGGRDSNPGRRGTAPEAKSLN